MAQLTLRVDDDLVTHLKLAAGARGQSVNAYAGAVLRAAVDPELGTDEAQRVRERLARAGLLAAAKSGPRPRRPDAEAVRQARTRAGRGTPLSELVQVERS